MHLLCPKDGAEFHLEYWPNGTANHLWNYTCTSWQGSLAADWQNLIDYQLLFCEMDSDVILCRVFELAIVDHCLYDCTCVILCVACMWYYTTPDIWDMHTIPGPTYCSRLENVVNMATIVSMNCINCMLEHTYQCNFFPKVVLCMWKSWALNWIFVQQFGGCWL